MRANIFLRKIFCNYKSDLDMQGIGHWGKNMALINGVKTYVENSTVDDYEYSYNRLRITHKAFHIIINCSKYNKNIGGVLQRATLHKRIVILFIDTHAVITPLLLRQQQTHLKDLKRVHFLNKIQRRTFRPSAKLIPIESTLSKIGYSKMYARIKVEFCFNSNHLIFCL